MTKLINRPMFVDEALSHSARGSTLDRRQILASNVDPSDEKIKIFIMAVDP